ncbi:MAG: hypothetical protein H7Y08_05020 [Rhizobiaceae bacterium]|nr:hypothetical protein [Rhizobiaceae bacterium]
MIWSTASSSNGRTTSCGYPLLATIAAAIALVTSASAEDLPFVGTWDCEISTFVFTPETYDTGSDVLDILEAQEGTDGSYTLFFADDYIITLSGFTGDAMGWYSPASGDSFACARLAD